MRVPGARGFDIDLALGEAVEDAALVVVLGREKIEVKYQPEAEYSLFIETAYRGKPSGLETTTAKWWCIVYAQGRQMQIIRADVLAELCRNRGRRSRGGDDNASEGWVVPITEMARPYP